LSSTHISYIKLCLCSSIFMFLWIPNSFQLKLFSIMCSHLAHFAQTLTTRSQELQTVYIK
jgi:hypothetical protein